MPMSGSEAAVLFGGVLSLGMFLFHLGFPKLFAWERDLKSVSESGCGILQTIHLALLLLFLLFGMISLLYCKELARCHGLAFGVCLFYSLFWLWRMVWQIVYFHPSGKRHVWLHRVLIAVFLVLWLAYALPVVGVLMGS